MTPQTNKDSQKQKLKKYLVFTVMIAVFIACLWLIFAPSAADKEAEQQGVGFNADIPDPKGDGIVGDKKTAYEQEQARLKQEEKMRSLQDYTFMLGSTDEDSEEYKRQVAMAPVPPDYQDDLNEGRISRSGNTSRRVSSFEASNSVYHDIGRTLENFYEEPVTDTEKEELKSEVEQLRNLLNEQQTMQLTVDDQLALLEKSYELAARYTGNQQQEPEPVEPERPGRKTKVTPITQVRENVVTSLAAPMSDLEFVQMFSQPRNTGFNTVAEDEDARDKNTISAVVHGDQVLVDGQSVKLRMTEPMRAGRHNITRNTILTGVCRLGGERLEIEISSIEYEGNIIPVDMKVYDSDGQQGIYIPGSMEIAAFKEIAGNMGQSLGTTINLNQQSAGQQLMNDLGRGAIQGTSQYISKKAKQIKVTLKSGYRIFLLPGETY